MADIASVAYCGPAAVPADLLSRWNLDPPLVVALAVLGLVLVMGRSANARAGSAALALMVFIFVSPLCALSAALFSARVLHHVLLVSVIAPLLALAFPAQKLPLPPLFGLVGLHAMTLWGWHMPTVYEWGVASVPTYWLMQATLLGSAWALWRTVLSPTTEAGSALIALVTTVAQMGLLAALIVFAPRTLYDIHLASTIAWGISPLRDQQLAGLLMWVPAALPYLGVGLWLAGTRLIPVRSAA
jgi:putative membrane protein